MKKILAGTTALIAVGALSSAAQAAEPIKLTVGGFMNQWVSVAKVDSKKATGQSAQTDWSYNNAAVNSDTEIHFKGATVLDNGLKVAVVIEHEAERTDATARNSDQQYVTLSGGWGQVRVGEMLNAATVVHNQAPGAGAAFSDVATILSVGGTTAAGNSVRDFASQVTSVDGINDAGAGSTAIDYISPMFGPFAFGITYTPQVFGRGLAREGASSKDLLGAALVYADKWGPVAIAADVAYARFEQLEANQSNIASGQGGMAHGIPVGIKLSYAGFDIGGSYIRVLDNAKASNGGGASYDGHAWDAGIAYTTGNWKFGYQYYASSLEDSINVHGTDTTKIHNLGGAYTMGPGVTVSANLAHLSMKDEANTANDKIRSYGLITGIQLAF